MGTQMLFVKDKALACIGQWESVFLIFISQWRVWWERHTTWKTRKNKIFYHGRDYEKIWPFSLSWNETYQYFSGNISQLNMLRRILFESLPFYLLLPSGTLERMTPALQQWHSRAIMLPYNGCKGNVGIQLTVSCVQYSVFTIGMDYFKHHSWRRTCCVAALNTNLKVK